MRLANALRPSLPSFLMFALFLLGVLSASCAGSSDSARLVEGGALLARPGTSELFFQDTHRGGGGSRLRLVQVSWGRLVDVYDVDPIDGEPSAVPLLRDLVIDESLQGDGLDYRLERDPVTLAERLIVLRSAGRPDAGSGTFEDLVRRATANLAPVHARHDDPSRPGISSFVARNAVLVLTFDDLLDDGPEARAELAELVQVLVGSPPVEPFATRLLFDPSHGGLVGDEFHSTRILVDPTISEAELAGDLTPLELNGIGFPALARGGGEVGGSLRIPTRRDPASGQFRVLRSLGGAALDPRASAPQDPESPTRDVVRGFRPGSPGDTNNGFLFDVDRPRLLGSFRLDVESVSPDPLGVPGVDLLLGVRFPTACVARPAPGDAVVVGDARLAVTTLAQAPDSVTGVVNGLRVRSHGGAPAEPSSLLGGGSLLTVYDPGVGVPPACWVSFSPEAETVPGRGVLPTVEIRVRFSEPIDPAGLSPSSSFRVSRGGTDEPPTSVSSVVGTVRPSLDGRVVAFRGELPLSHEAGREEEYTLRLGTGGRALHDLAGNPLAEVLPPLTFTLHPDAPTLRTSGILLGFDELDEYRVGLAADKDDVRGQIFYDFASGSIRPRTPVRATYDVDAANPVGSLMTPFAPGVQAPLSPLGAKVQWVWRYCDLGWLADDESKYDIDVEGLGWSPVGGVRSDFFERFEIRVSHSKKLPDEWVDPAVGKPFHSQSGLSGTAPFASNVLGEQVVVHDREFGYEIDPIDQTVTATGVPIMPYPWNRGGGPRTTFTWRDTSLEERGGDGGGGIPLEIEARPPLQLYGATQAGAFAGGGDVPTYGLPLLMEVRCFPTTRALGLNAADLAISQVTSFDPKFRIFSWGGIDSQMNPVAKDPDLEVVPSGGFNPLSTPPFLPTIAKGDSWMYLGRLDTVIRVSRMHTIWFDAGTDTPDFVPELVEPRAEDQPRGTSLLVEFRGATSFRNTQGAELDAQRLDPYGEPMTGRVLFTDGPGWSPTIEAVDGSPFFQARVTFVNDLDSGLSPRLDALGFTYVVD